MNENPYDPPGSYDDEPPERDRSLQPIDDGESLIVLATFDNSVEASLFQNELARFGIDSRLANETSASTLGLTIAGPSAAFWVEVLIRKTDAERGLQIKSDWLAKSSDSEGEIPEWTCDCGETVDAGFGVCWNCNAEYPGQP